MGSGTPDPHRATEPVEPSLQIFQTHPGIRVSEDRIRSMAEAIGKGENVRWNEVNIVLVDHERLHAMNRDWLDHDYETDVLSFLLDKEAAKQSVIDGEVYVDVETAEERAPEFSTTIEEEILRYVAHGLLHLCGHDDASDEERKTIRRLEDRYLADPQT